MVSRDEDNILDQIFDISNLRNKQSEINIW